MVLVRFFVLSVLQARKVSNDVVAKLDLDFASIYKSKIFTAMTAIIFQ